MNRRDLRNLAADFIDGKVSFEHWQFHFAKAMFNMDRNAAVKLAQAVFFMAPEAGDG